jgi:hypothetical protein
MEEGAVRVAVDHFVAEPTRASTAESLFDALKVWSDSPRQVVPPCAARGVSKQRLSIFLLRIRGMVSMRMAVALSVVARLL